MDFFTTLVSIFLHLDEHLRAIIDQYGTLTYLLLFLIIFCETGLVVTPFLPGDSLLFAAGAFAAGSNPPLNLGVLLLILSIAAILGDTVNYWIGHWVGPRAFSGKVPFLRQSYLERTHAFYEKYGWQAVILARFVPIVRTFAPFVAGVGAMNYPRFISYNVIGGLLWVFLFTLAGYFFGNLPVVQHNFTLVVLAIIAVSVLPAVYEIVRDRLRARTDNKAPAQAE
jgi:membrane-associated protein